MTCSLPTHSTKYQSVDAANAYFMSRYPGYRLTAFQPHPQTGNLDTLTLTPLEAGVVCPKCATYCNRWKEEKRQKEILDWDIVAGQAIKVVIPSRRMRCRCGCQKTESDPLWQLPNHRISKRLAAWVQRLLRCRISLKDVVRITGVGWKLVKQLDKAALQYEHGEPKDLSHVRRLALDEISLHKGHKYATVVMDLEDRAIIHVAKGKRIQDVQPFFDQLKAGGFDQQIQSVSVDMNAGFPRLIKENLPKAKIAYDRFHVMQQLTRQVLVEAKRFSIQKAIQTYRNLSARERKDKNKRQERDVAIACVKSAEWLVLTNPQLLSESRQQRLRQLRENNQLFADLYAFIATLKTVWSADSEQTACNQLNQCIELCEAMAQEHSFKPIQTFGRMLKRRAQGIVSACVVGYGTNILEGANNTAKVIKRIAYGFRDFEYFALKLKGAFPGKRHKKAISESCWSLVWQGDGETLTFPHFFR